MKYSVFKSNVNVGSFQPQQSGSAVNLQHTLNPYQPSYIKQKFYQQSSITEGFQSAPELHQAWPLTPNSRDISCSPSVTEEAKSSILNSCENDTTRQKKSNKKSRTFYTPDQVSMLEEKFYEPKFVNRYYLNYSDCNELSRKTRLSEQQVLKWFSNKRCTIKKQNKAPFL